MNDCSKYALGTCLGVDGYLGRMSQQALFNEVCVINSSMLNQKGLVIVGA